MTILWTVNDRDGKALPLRDKEVHLYYTCERGRFEADIEIQRTNVVAWYFLGRDQRALGNYTLSLEILQSDGKRSIKKDMCDAFTLVGKSCEEKYDKKEADVNEGGEIVLASNLDIYRISPIIPYVIKDANGIGHWYVEGVNTGDRSTGESAYEYAKTKGFEGREEEFAALMADTPNVSARLTELSAEVEELKNTSGYVADFFVEDLETLLAGIVDRIPANLDAIVQAWKNNLRVLVPYRDLDGYAVLVGFAEDLIYGTVVYHNGIIFIDAQYGGGKDWITSGEVTKQESGGSYDDTEIRNEIAAVQGVTDFLSGTVDSQNTKLSELSAKLSQFEQYIEVGKDIINFTNPVGPHCPDPCFWKADDGYFYIKGTGRRSKVLRTRDFVNYEDTGRTFLSESALRWLDDNYGTLSGGAILVPHCWAPFVIKIGNNWVLYMAVVERKGDFSNPTDGAAHIVAFTSRTPYGDFTNPVTIVSDGDFMLTNSVVWENVIDPFVYCNPQDQKIYLVAGSSYSIGRLELSDDGLATVLEKGVGNKCLRMAGLTISSDPSREQVYEGAYIYSRPFNGKTYHYLFASKGHYAEDNYALVAFRCTDLNAVAGDFNNGWSDIYGTSPITKVNTQHAKDRVILSGYSKDSGKPWGPGHCAGIFETADGKTWMLYHCHTGDGTNDRQLFIQEVLWDKSGGPYFEGGKPVYSGKILNNIITDTPKVL